MTRERYKQQPCKANSIEAFLRGDSDARLATGWREALAGSPVRSLLEGGAAVAFAGNGELVIEQRSRKPLS